FMHPDTASILERYLRLLADEGEDAAFWQIREELEKAKWTSRNSKKQDAK
ncbi:MAG: hypothetical protein GX685_02460, partial [Clostridiales bacterium]|nr:hypothetical protein [Clostridiales bacterium]